MRELIKGTKNRKKTPELRPKAWVGAVVSLKAEHAQSSKGKREGKDPMRVEAI